MNFFGICLNARCLLVLDDVDSHASWSSILLKACIDHRMLLDVNGLGEEVRGHVCDQGHGTCSSVLQKFGCLGYILGSCVRSQAQTKHSLSEEASLRAARVLLDFQDLHNILRHTVRVETITELILKMADRLIFMTFLLELIAFRPTPVICPARRAKPENYSKPPLIPDSSYPAMKSAISQKLINSWKRFSGSAIILVPTMPTLCELGFYILRTPQNR